MTKVDLSAIILTYNEELHIRRCLEKICGLVKDVFIIDCFSKDKTCEIAKEFDNVQILEHEWPGNQAAQFNWALNSLKISTEWIIRLDADEYLLPETIEEIMLKLPSLEEKYTGIVLKRRHIFMNKWMKKGTYPVKLMRIFRYGKAVCEQRLMDEHIQLLEGECIEFDNDFCDHNINNLSYFCHKHVDYAIREAIELLNIELDITGSSIEEQQKKLSEQAMVKRKKKYKYAKLPLFLRAFMYFFMRYFLKLGFTEGKIGFLWHFIQGWWYRTLVDAKVFEIKQHCGTDKEKIKKYIKDNYNISL